MAECAISVRYDPEVFNRFNALKARGFSGPGLPPVDTMFTQWADFYSNWSRRRYLTLARSGGGGEWPPLAMSTVLARRPFGKGLSKRNMSAKRRSMREIVRIVMRNGGTSQDVGASILLDTGQLLTALDIGATGNFVRRSGPSMEFGIGGSEQHQAPKSKKGVRHLATIGQIAAYHQNGGGHLPQRKILVRPPDGDPIYARMARAGAVCIKALWNMAVQEGANNQVPT